METRATLLLRLKTDGPAREVAWAEFCRLYEPIIARFARGKGLRADEVEEVVQSVLTGFFAAQPRFAYDPGRGRFRGYLMACVSNAVRSAIRRADSRGKERALPDDVPAPEDRDAWDRAWQQEALDRAVAAVRQMYDGNVTFQAFEAVVVRGQSPDAVAASLGISRDSVYQAKTRVLAKVRIELDRIEAELDGG
jgi:RNA polymerase sigma-70 factor (ECF subfamily)